MLMRRRRRSKRGSELAEFGPAVFIIFILVLFPMINLICIALSYCCCWYLCHMAAREVARVDWHNQGLVDSALNAAKSKWMGSGLGSFVKGGGGMALAATFNNQHNDPMTIQGGTPRTIADSVTVSITNFQIPPMCPLPWVASCPGINAPVKFDISETAPQEDQGET